jgi:hypothetical protein
VIWSLRGARDIDFIEEMSDFGFLEAKCAYSHAFIYGWGRKQDVDRGVAHLEAGASEGIQNCISILDVVRQQERDGALPKTGLDPRRPPLGKGCKGP